MPIAVCKLFALPSLWAAAPPWRSAAPPPDSRIIPPAHRMRSQSASLAGARSAFTARPASGGGEQDGRREPWRMQRRTRRVPRRRSRARHCPDRRISAGHQRTASLAPTLGAARTMEGPAAASPIKSTARAMVRASRATPLRTAPGAPSPFAGQRKQAPGGKSAREGQRHQGTRSVPRPDQDRADCARCQPS
jgi:hypothetical protein